MTDFVEQLRLAEKAAEDIYFAKVNRELIEALHRKMHADDGCDPRSDQAEPDGAGAGFTDTARQAVKTG